MQRSSRCVIVNQGLVDHAPEEFADTLPPPLGHFHEGVSPRRRKQEPNLDHVSRTGHAWRFCSRAVAGSHWIIDLVELKGFKRCFLVCGKDDSKMRTITRQAQTNKVITRTLRRPRITTIAMNWKSHRDSSALSEPARSSD